MKTLDEIISDVAQENGFNRWVRTPDVWIHKIEPYRTEEAMTTLHHKRLKI